MPFAIAEPITAGLIISFFNKFVMPLIVNCCDPELDVDDWGSSSESSAVNADVEVHLHYL
jgi:hypothetical protein